MGGSSTDPSKRDQQQQQGANDSSTTGMASDGQQRDERARDGEGERPDPALTRALHAALAGQAPPSSTSSSRLRRQQPGGESLLPGGIHVSTPDERCWISCSQKNWDRARSKLPDCSAMCYINLRKELRVLAAGMAQQQQQAQQPRRPGAGQTRVMLVEDDKEALEHSRKLNPAADAAAARPRNGAAAPSTSTADPSKGDADPFEGIPEYHWPFLDGRYFYFARGTPAVERHLREMATRGVDAILAAQSRVAERDQIKQQRIEELRAALASARRGGHASVPRAALPPGTAGSSGNPSGNLGGMTSSSPSGAHPHGMGGIASSLGLDGAGQLGAHVDFNREPRERVYPLSALWSDTWRRAHRHILRIYSPVFRNLARLPETYTDGTQERMAKQMYEKFTDGSALRLLESMAQSLGRVVKFIEQRRNADNDSSSSSGPGGSGGGPPPLPPPPPRA